MAQKNREYMEMLANYDSHPDGKVRINLLFKNCPKFIETFKIKEGDGMYIPPEEQFRIW